MMIYTSDDNEISGDFEWVCPFCSCVQDITTSGTVETGQKLECISCKKVNIVIDRTVHLTTSKNTQGDGCLK